MCHIPKCKNRVTHFIIKNNSILESCMYHYCIFYNIDIREESEIYKEYLKNKNG